MTNFLAKFYSGTLKDYRYYETDVAFFELLLEHLLEFFITFFIIDDSAKGGLTQFWEFTMILCATKYLKR